MERMNPMRGQIITVLGGARSGKSTFAERLARKLDQPTAYIATAQNRDGEMGERILKHQASRPETWETVEEPYELATAITRASLTNKVILVDCITLFLSNLLLQGLGDLDSNDNPPLPQSLERDLLQRMDEVIQAALVCPSLVIFVANEVGQGIVPLYRSARVFRDVAGRANQLLAKHSSKVFHVRAGIATELKSLEVSLEDICQELSYGG